MKKVHDYLVYLEEILGVGMYGKVCKAYRIDELQLEQAGQREIKPEETTLAESTRCMDVDKVAKRKSKTTYACKIIETAKISQEDLDCITKEINIHSKVKSECCVRLYQTIKTTSNMYMI